MDTTCLPDSREADGDEPHAQQLHASPHQYAEQHRELRRRSEHVSMDQLFAVKKASKETGARPTRGERRESKCQVRSYTKHGVEGLFEVEIPLCLRLFEDLKVQISYDPHKNRMEIKPCVAPTQLTIAQTSPIWHHVFYGLEQANAILYHKVNYSTSLDNA